MKKNQRYIALFVGLFLTVATSTAQRVRIVTQKQISAREQYAADYLRQKLTELGYEVTPKRGKYKITLSIARDTTGLSKEGFRLIGKKKSVVIEGRDGAGVIYGAVELADRAKNSGKLTGFGTITSNPQMVMRGTCIGMQKTEYLPGHTVYEYPYTPENFPWFYDKEQWIDYLDMMVDNRFNSLYLWNGHPFASLVKLKDYPFALEVDEETFRKNEDMFSFLTQEADKRGICIIQMFYNIILSKPFADHYGLKTQDRNRPISPLISDYTRKSIAAFVEKYPNVGFLVCLGEAMATIDDDVTWMKETIIPGIKDGLAASGRTDTPPIVLRSHDTDGPLVLKESLPLYPNIYTMSKYTGESLTTYQPGGPWGETHRQLAAAAPVHIDNVHILANLEPWRWSSPDFVQKAVCAMHDIHHSKGLHLYPQASYWDWPYTADRMTDGSRMKQLDRDWMWYKAWGRYSWGTQGSLAAAEPTEPQESYPAPASYWSKDDGETSYWIAVLSNHYGLDSLHARRLLKAYDEVGEIAPKLLRRFGITEGNRQTLLLGMKAAQLVNPYKFTVYPGFYESCGPKGEKLIEFAEREYRNQPHEGELPVDIVEQCVAHGEQAVEAMKGVVDAATRHLDELERVQNDMECYRLFALSFRYKVLGALQVLNYKWYQDLHYLDAAIPFFEQSLDYWRQLTALADRTYLYANSMQTAQRRIPVGGDHGKMKTWGELLTVYQEELEALKFNIAKLKHPVKHTNVEILPAQPATVELFHPVTSVTLHKGAVLFEKRADTRVTDLAPELKGLQALVLNRDTTRIKGTSVEFNTEQPVKMLVGFFQDDDHKWAKPPKLEVDATGNEYGQAEPVLTSAISLRQMPKVNVHQYQLPVGHHTLNLPKGIIMVLGFTTSDIEPRDVGLNSADNEVDWLFQR